MKSKKLSLKSIKVKSFVTEISSQNVKKTVKGGETLGCSIDIGCDPSAGAGPYCSAYCSGIICPATFGTGGPCDGPAPTKNAASQCICL